MKKTILLATALIFGSLSFQSCDEWEDESYHPGGTTTELVGTWKLTEIKLAQAVDYNGDGVSSTDLMAETNCYQNELLEFFENNNGKVTSNSYADISMDAQGVYTIECVQELEISDFTWAATQGNYTMIYEDELISFTIIGDKITFVVIDGLFVQTEDDFIPFDLTFTYTKQ